MFRSVVVKVIGSAAGRVELQHVRTAGTLQAEADLFPAVHAAVVKVNGDNLTRRQGGKAASGDFIAACAARHAQGVAARAVDVIGRTQIRAREVANVIAGRRAAEGAAAATRGPGAAPAVVVMLGPGIGQARTGGGDRERGGGT